MLEKENIRLRALLEKAYRKIQSLVCELHDKTTQLENLKKNVKNIHETEFILCERAISSKEAEIKDLKSLLAKTKIQIDNLNEENQIKVKKIEELQKRLNEAVEHSVFVLNNSDERLNDGLESKVNELTSQVNLYQSEILKMEQKLYDAKEEKDYYKKNYQSKKLNNSPVDNVSPNANALNDEIGRELMHANKRKYQLESKIKQMDEELKDSQLLVQNIERSLKNTEKLLWLEKERTVTLEAELRSSNFEMDLQRKQIEELNKEIERFNIHEDYEVLNEINELNPNDYFKENIDYTKELNNYQKDYKTKINLLLDQKSKAEYRINELTQNYHDAKWRIGELEAELEKKNNEITDLQKQVGKFESNLTFSENNTDSELFSLKNKINNLIELKSKVEWRLGEVTQFWNDAKWRVGELESEISHIKHEFNEARCYIFELENRSSDKKCENITHEKNVAEWRLGEVSQQYHDTKWRVGELEADLRAREGHITYLESKIANLEATKKLNTEFECLHQTYDELKDEKNKIEWRLNEVTHFWNDIKSKYNELQQLYDYQKNEVKILKETYEKNDGLLNLNTLDLFAKLYGSFIVRKQENSNRQNRNTLLWENTLGKNIQLRRVFFETNAKDDSQIFLIGSFVNWECAFLCEYIFNNSKKQGIWIDLPPGKHEFRFISNGKWFTSENYDTILNEFGETNNFLYVD